MTRNLSPARVLLPMGLAVCLSPCGDLALYAVLVTQLQVVGLTLGAVGIMLGVNRLIRIPGNPLAGLLLDRRGRRGMFLAGMALGVLSTAGCAVMRGFWPFLVARLAWGAAWTLINVSGMAMVVDVTTSSNRGRWMGVYNTWVLVGLGIGPILGAFFVDALGFRGGMLACAAVTAVGLAVALVALPETSRFAGARAVGDGQAPGTRRSTAEAGSPDSGGLRRLWRTAPGSTRSSVRQGAEGGAGRAKALLAANAALVSALALFLLSQFAGDGIVLSTVSLLLKQRFGEQVAMAGLAVGAATASGLIIGVRSLLAGLVGPAAGHLSDRRLSRWSVVALGLVSSAAGFGLLAYDASLAAIVIGVALSAVGSGAALASLAALVGDLTPPGREGSVMGAYAAAGDVGSTAGPFLAFALVATVDLRWIYLGCCLAFLAALLLARLGRRAGRAGRPDPAAG